MANLWDVTDRDIDRFSQALLKTWLGEGDREEGPVGGVGADSSVSRSSCSARAGPRSSRGSRARAVNQAASQESGSHRAGEQCEQQQAAVCSSVSASVGACRSVCRLPHLIGAAPVCYGVPLDVVWRQ